MNTRNLVIHRTNNFRYVKLVLPFQKFDNGVGTSVCCNSLMQWLSNVHPNGPFLFKRTD